MIDATATSIPLTGLALALFATSAVCLVLSAITVSLRLYARLQDSALGLDDGLILAGLVIYAVDVALACYGATVGLGSRTADINLFMMVEGMKYLMLWMLVYVIGLAVIKSSICATLLRIAGSNKLYRASIFALLGLTVVTFLVTFVGILLLCQPVSGNWTGKGKCASMQTMIALSYTSTASTITTDLACVVVPGFMLWNVQMKPLKKASVFILLSFASIASITTIFRAPYIERYWKPLDNLTYWTGYIVLYSNVESAIGLIASSLPTLRKLFLRSTGSTKSTPRSVSELVTIGSEPRRKRNSGFTNPTDQGISFATVRSGGRGEAWTMIEDVEGEGGSREGGSGDRERDMERGREKERERGKNAEGNGMGEVRMDRTYDVQTSPLSKSGEGFGRWMPRQRQGQAQGELRPGVEGEFKGAVGY
ncbi:hypothetical protein EG327_000785 [Venturia inaequalis]|uniref:Rhodopsin domain-containing protein n=1 Tax=Venturia inaequalis TaxID=5025 RepID=A0A8H3VQ61_VENIN|nr:hypothetical protein EG327_000785 [Venturia inaequalis]